MRHPSVFEDVLCGLTSDIPLLLSCPCKAYFDRCLDDVQEPSSTDVWHAAEQALPQVSYLERR